MAYGALGGGTFLVQNKTLPGAYINYVSVPRASNQFSDRGYATIGMELDWGPVGEIITVEPADLQTNSLELFGYEYTSDKLKPLREVMLGAKVLYLYRLNDNEGVQATGKLGENITVTAKYPGIAGNKISLKVENDIDTEGNFIVTTKMNGIVVDKQSVAKATDLKDNSVVTFKATDETIQTNAGLNLTNGENGKVTGQSHSNYLEKIEKFDFNTIGYAGTDDTIKGLYKAFTKRMRDDEGVKFQCVAYNVDKNKANFEGLINIKNKAKEEDQEGALVYWLTGQEAGCDVNKSITNKKYDGEYTIDTDYKTRELKQDLIDGYFVFYEKNGEVRVLEDINSFTEYTLYKNEDFGKNQVIRVLDQRAIDIAIIFNKRYLGKVQNNEDGRIAFWNELVKHAQTLTKLGAIENYDPKDSKVRKGDAKDTIVVDDYLMPVMAMTKLYHTIWVR